jgi:hypothetical protein
MLRYNESRYIMKSSDILIYETSLKLYSDIMSTHGKNKTITEIRECMETFERLEDYDKCKDLLNLMKIEFNNSDDNKQ